MEQSATATDGRAVRGFQIRPVPASAGRCPRCESAIDVERLHFGVWRPVLEGRCRTCGHRYLQDLPTAHGLRYGATIDVTTGETWGEWFGRQIVDSWTWPDERPVSLRVEILYRATNPVLLDCLDFIYGHALLRMLNATRHIDDSADDLILLVPRALSPLVPEGAAEVWTVDEPLGRLRNWLLDLDDRVSAELDRLGRCTLSPAYPHPHPSTFDIGRYVGAAEPRPTGEPSVVFVLREQRFWGGSEEEQERRVREASERLRARFPRAGVSVLGVGSPGSEPGIADLREPEPTERREREWLSVLAGADLAIGVHGSNLLLPSALARATIELLPLERFDNFGQATIVTDPDPVAALLRHHTLHGAEDLADVSAERVAALASAILASGPSLRTSMLGSLAGQELAAPRAPEPSFATAAQEPERPAQPLPQRLLDFAADARQDVARHRATRARERRVEEIGAPAVVEDPHGVRLRMLDRDEVERFVGGGYRYETLEAEVARRYLEPGGSALELGGRIGWVTAAMASAVGPEGSVDAVVPSDQARRRILETLELNELTHVRLHPETVPDSAEIDLLRIESAGDVPAALARDAAAAILMPLPGDGAVAAAEQLERRGMRLYAVSEPPLRPFQPIGRLDRPVRVLAATPRARERLRAASVIESLA